MIDLNFARWSAMCDPQEAPELYREYLTPGNKVTIILPEKRTGKIRTEITRAKGTKNNMQRILSPEKTT